jgi:hypothetical protein
MKHQTKTLINNTNINLLASSSTYPQIPMREFQISNEPVPQLRISSSAARSFS